MPIMKNTIEKIVILLKRLGLSSFEARAYSAFMLGDNLHPKDISTYAKIPFSRVYSTMKELEDKGLIDINRFDNPISYKLREPSISLQHLLNLYQKRLENEIAELRELTREIIKDIESVGKKEGGSKLDTYYSNEMVYSELIPMLINSAKKEVIIVGSNVLETVNEEFFDAIYNCINKNVKFRFIVPKEIVELLSSIATIDKAAEIITTLQTNNLLEIRAIDLMNITPFGIFDREKVGFSVQSPKGRYIVTHLTNDADIIEEFYETFNLLWSNAMQIDLVKLMNIRQ